MTSQTQNSDDEDFHDALDENLDDDDEMTEEELADCLSALPDIAENSCNINSDAGHTDLPDESTQSPESPHNSNKIEEDELQERIKAENLLTDEQKAEYRKSSQEMKVKGNELFRDQKYSEAVDSYSDALATCPLCFEKDRSIFFSNRSACYAKLNDKESALKDCDRALELDPGYVKCLLRRAELRESSDKLTEALEDYQKVLQLDPSISKARAACMGLPERIKEQQEKMKAEMLGQLKQLGNLVLKPFGLSTDNFQMVQDPNSGGYSVNFKK